MAVELTKEEADLLKELLEAALAEIKSEVRHTETRGFRDVLREREEKMRELLDRL